MTESTSQLRITSSRLFPRWLTEQNVSLGFTTFQAGRVFLIGVAQDGQLSISQRSFARPMAICSDGTDLWLSTAYQIWRFGDAGAGVAALDGYESFDRVLLPRLSWTTGDLDVHELAILSDKRLVFANTLYSCLATLDPAVSFVPIWRPPFVDRLAAEDRCHLNGLAIQDGRPRWVTVVGRSDVADGWRDHRVGGGLVLDLPSGDVALDGLSMPHSPRWHDGRLWLIDSGTGWFGHADLDRHRFQPLTALPGYGRGLAFVGRYAVVGLSRPRDGKDFGGLPLDRMLDERNVVPRTGLVVIDTRNGDIVEWLRVEGSIEELYDVTVLPGVRRPALIGLVTSEVRKAISIGDEAPFDWETPRLAQPARKAAARSRALL